MDARRDPLKHPGSIGEQRKTCSIEEFDREREPRLDWVRQSGDPLVFITEAQQAFVVQSEDAYLALLRRLEFAECVIGFEEGRASFARGEGLPLDEAFEEIRRSVERDPAGRIMSIAGGFVYRP